MKHNYLIASEDSVAILDKVHKIVTEIGKKEIETIHYDMTETTIDELLEELNTYNFLADIKVVVAKNCTFLEGNMSKETKKLYEYLKNPSENILILCCAKVGEKKEIKEIISLLEVINPKISTELLIKKNLEGFSMENKTVKYFAEYCLYNNEKVLNELEKIKCYKLGDPNSWITIEDINRIALKEYDEDIFDLVNAIAKRNREGIFALYERILEHEKDVVNIVASVSSQIRLLYSVKVLSNKGLTTDQMASILGVKTMAVSIALNNCGNFSEKKLLSLLNLLADLDYRAKSGNGSGSLLFEIFLLNV